MSKSAAAETREYIRGVLANFEARQSEIMSSSRLSDDAKRADMQDLDAFTRDKLTAWITDVWRPGGKIQSELAAAEAKLKEAKERLNDGVNWQRLEYASRSVPAIIGRAVNVEAALKEYSEADAYTRRAMQDTGETAAVTKWGGAAGALVSRLRADKRLSQETPEVKAAAEAIKQLKIDTADAYTETGRALASIRDDALSPAWRVMRCVQVSGRMENPEADIPGFDYVITWRDNPAVIMRETQAE